MDLKPATATDLVRRFIFEKRPVRGHWVRLEHAWRELRAHAQYPPAVSELLGQAVAASVLLAATLKFRGTLTFQLQGNGAVGLLVAQCGHDFRLRAVARCDPEAVHAASADPARGARFRHLVGSEGRITVTIEAEEKSLRYQGVVPLSGTSLSESLEAYFASSEQLPTRVLLAADESCVAGLLVQKLPDAGSAHEEEVQAAWQGAQRGIEHLDAVELLHWSAEELLARGFSGHDLRLFRGAPVQFQCRCSQGRVAGLLRALGADEVRGVLKEQGSVLVTCEFCHHPYRFDAADVEVLFSETSANGSEVIH
ncbi:MAG TPA: Hsp33 family molecular chaperone HslO [Candidatus Dormibacteraeota bacterium]|nr:Hsp33 family molecular chaperone HslO [Candidatus Dormibacteraeota bacterium]